MTPRIVVENPALLKFVLVVGIVLFLGGGAAGLVFAGLGDLTWL